MTRRNEAESADRARRALRAAGAGASALTAALLLASCGLPPAIPQVSPEPTPSVTPSATPSSTPSATPDVPDDEDQDDQTDGILEFVTIQDSTGLLTVDVPAHWTDIWGDETYQTYNLDAAPDLDSFYQTWDTPGIIFTADQTGDHTVESILEMRKADVPDCTLIEEAAYSDGFFTGSYVDFDECGNADAEYSIIAAHPDTWTGEGPAPLVTLEITMVSETDKTEVLQRVLDTFMLTR